MENPIKSSGDIADLIAIMAALRTKDSGCAWDLEQTFASIAPYTLEEAHEVVEAISRGDLEDLREELGDLLLQVVFHARMAEEVGAFDFGSVVEAITAKLIRRHPHVFGDVSNLTPDEVKALWDRIKGQEKAEKAQRRARAGIAEPSGLLGSVSQGAPTLARAFKLQEKAGSVGFDWADPLLVLDKIREEADEVASALALGDVVDVESEIGDLMFAVVNLARHAKVDPDSALRAANAKFLRRFSYIERALNARGRGIAESNLQEMDDLWTLAKKSGL